MFPRPESQFPTPYTFLSTDFSNFKSEMIYDSTFQREATHTHTHTFRNAFIKIFTKRSEEGGTKKRCGKISNPKDKKNETKGTPPPAAIFLLSTLFIYGIQAV